MVQLATAPNMHSFEMPTHLSQFTDQCLMHSSFNTIEWLYVDHTYQLHQQPSNVTQDKQLSISLLPGSITTKLVWWWQQVLNKNSITHWLATCLWPKTGGEKTLGTSLQVWGQAYRSGDEPTGLGTGSGHEPTDLPGGSVWDSVEGLASLGRALWDACGMRPQTDHWPLIAANNNMLLLAL